MTKGDLIKDFLIPVWQERRLYQLHNCPDCDKAWIRNIGWSDIESTSYGSRKRGKGVCVQCNKIITIVLVGIWIELWSKQWGWDY